VLYQKEDEKEVLHCFPLAGYGVLMLAGKHFTPSF